MNILFISDNFYPESNALANRLYDHARTWIKEGHRVTVMTCAPNFPRGELLPGYKNRWRQVECIDGINVIRVKTYIAENKGSLKRILDNLSFGVNAAVQGLFVRKPDIVIGASPQPFAVFAAWFVAKLKRKPFIFELRDLWPESIIAVGAMKSNNKLLKMFELMIKRLYKSADVIVSVTDSFKKILVEREYICEDKIVVCKNGINTQAIIPSIDKCKLKHEYGLTQQYLIGYVGTIGMAHHIQTIVEAAELFNDDSLHFVIMGAGSSADEIESRIEGLDNCTFIQASNRQGAINILNMLDASIVHLRNDPLFSTVIPSKIFESMALGKPLLVGVKGEAQDIVVHQAEAGYPFEPENAEDLLETIEYLRQNPINIEKSIDFVKKHFVRDEIALTMLEKIQQSLTKSGKYEKD